MSWLCSLESSRLQLGAKDRYQSFPANLHLQPWQHRSPASHIWTQTGLPALNDSGATKKVPRGYELMPALARGAASAGQQHLQPLRDGLLKRLSIRSCHAGRITPSSRAAGVSPAHLNEPSAFVASSNQIRWSYFLVCFLNKAEICFASQASFTSQHVACFHNLS